MPLVPALLLSFNLITAAAQPRPSEQEELLEQHRQLVAAIGKSDTGTMSRLIADDFTGIGLDAMPVGKPQLTASNNTPAAALVEYDETDLDMKMLGSCAVIASRASLATRLNNGTLIRRRHAVSRVWTKRDEGWRVVSGQMQPIVLTAGALELPAQSQAGSAFARFDDKKRDVLKAHLAYLLAPPADAAQRYAADYVGVAATGIVSGVPEIAAPAAPPPKPEVLEEPGRIVIRMPNSTVALDDWRVELYADTAVLSYRATYYTKAGLSTAQSRIGAVYTRRDERWQQVLGQTTNIIAEATR
jgi:ketosteroid isomerase-like protein